MTYTFIRTRYNKITSILTFAETKRALVKGLHQNYLQLIVQLNQTDPAVQLSGKNGAAGLGTRV